MFTGIQPSTFDDPGFKEDSVRELIIAPMLARLGYGPTGNPRVARSMAVKHPFIRVGTKNHPVTLVPDYVFFHNNAPIFVLDAKGPEEPTLDQRHIGQVYSYAIHLEIKVQEFGICNGRELAIFHIDKTDPISVLPFADFEPKWPEIEKLLSVEYLTSPSLRKFHPDFGTKLKRLNVGIDGDIVMPFVRLDLFARLNNEAMMASGNCDFAGQIHCVSFDFPFAMLGEILAGLPKPLAERFEHALNSAPFHAMAGLVVEIDLVARLGDQTPGQFEKFVPLMITRITGSRFNPHPVEPSAQEIPPNVFQLRNAFAIKTPLS